MEDNIREINDLKERAKVLENQVRFLRNWIYNISYPFAPMSARSELEGFDAIKEKRGVAKAIS